MLVLRKVLVHVILEVESGKLMITQIMMIITI